MNTHIAYDFKIASYNCRNLPKRKNDLYLRPDIKNLFDNNSIVCLQEIWYAKQDLKFLNSLRNDFIGFGSSRCNDSEKICYARGGVAIFYRKDVSKYVKQIETNLDWCNAIEISVESRKIMLINVYLPYQSDKNKEMYIQSLEAIRDIIDEGSSSSYIIIGDWNANLRMDQRSLFRKPMMDFCADNNLSIVDKEICPGDSYTYICEASGSHTWLDHIVCTVDVRNAIDNVRIAYDATDTDHIPICMDLNVLITPVLTDNDNNYDVKLKWDSLKPHDIEKYCQITEANLSNVKIHAETHLCTDLLCKDDNHIMHTQNLFTNIADILTNAGTNIFGCKDKRNANVPGWTDYVADLYDSSREARSLWLAHDKPRQGRYYQLYMNSRMKVKLAIRYVKKNEAQLRKDSLAKKLSSCSSKEFWKEIQSMNNSNTPLPEVIDNVSGANDILKVWKDHYSNLFNTLRKCTYDSNKYILQSSYQDVMVTIDEVKWAISKLELNKACGIDKMYAEHLKYASDRILPLLSICITSMFIHGYLPETLLSVVLVPIVKDKTGKISSKDNYRPIALASVMSKVIERIILERIETCLLTSPNQFGFKSNHGTDQCIFVLKEVVDIYTKLNSRVSVCFLDASKAFDRINHNVLFEKLRKRGICGYLLRILVYWYETQTMCVRWGNLISDSFTVSNGVRQGGILSPRLFAIYIDDLSLALNKLGIGCCVSDILINHLMYADDMVLIAPSTAALQILIKECHKFGIKHDMIFNPRKSAVMIFKNKNDRELNTPPFILNNEAIPVVEDYCYLGHIIDKEMNDEKDIHRQRKKLYQQGNSIIRKFSICTLDVKLILFKAYCTSMYTAQLWCNYRPASNNRGAMYKLYVAYHNTLKMFVGVSKFESNSTLCAYMNIPNCAGIIRNLIYKFRCRLESSSNNIIAALVNSWYKNTSCLWTKWHELLHVPQRVELT